MSTAYTPKAIKKSWAFPETLNATEITILYTKVLVNRIFCYVSESWKTAVCRKACTGPIKRKSAVEILLAASLINSHGLSFDMIAVGFCVGSIVDRLLFQTTEDQTARRPTVSLE
jgi:hypothetical protein